MALYQNKVHQTDLASSCKEFLTLHCSSLINAVSDIKNLLSFLSLASKAFRYRISPSTPTKLIKTDLERSSEQPVILRYSLTNSLYDMQNLSDRKTCKATRYGIPVVERR